MLKNFFSTIILYLFVISVTHAETNLSTSHASISPLAYSTQLVLVTTKNWGATSGVMQRFVRPDLESRWEQVGEPVPVVVGRNGLGWSKEVNRSPNFPGPVKQEGDGKSPAGIFRLSTSFGFQSPKEIKDVKLPYIQLTDSIECVDDVNSHYYNSIIDLKKINWPDWKSSEKMKGVGDRYQFGIVVDHNSKRIPGDGSCVFMHIWLNADTGTSGCIAMAPDSMSSLFVWLDPVAKPMLVQLTESDYRHLRKLWQLP